MGIDGRGDLLTSSLPRRLQDGLADAEGERKVRQYSPGVLHIPFVLVRLEVPVDGGAVVEERAGGGTAHGVVVDVGDLGDDTDEIGICLLVRTAEATVDGIQTQTARIGGDCRRARRGSRCPN